MNFSSEINKTIKDCWSPNKPMKAKKDDKAKKPIKILGKIIIEVKVV